MGLIPLGDSYEQFQTAVLKSQTPTAVFLPHRLLLRMGIIAFARLDFVAVLLGNDLDFAEFSIPVLVLWVVAEAVLVMKFV